MSDKLKIGVIGVGGMGRGHVKDFNTSPDCEVTACADLADSNLDAVKEKSPSIKTYTNYQEMLDKENLDAVSIVTPNKLHKLITLDAINAGCHVLCEKPMALNAKEAVDMKNAADKAGKQLMIHFNHRMSPDIRVLKQAIDDGRIGTPYMGRSVWHRRWGMPGFGGWFGQKALSGGGPLIDLGVHRLDMALYLMNYPKPVSVSGAAFYKFGISEAQKENKKFDVEDSAAGFIRFENGAVLTLEASWVVGIGQQELMETRIFGDKGGLVQKNIGGEYKTEAELYTMEHGAFLTSKIALTKDYFPSCQQHFADCILGRAQPIITADQGIKVMQILDALYESATSSKEIEIK